MSQNKRQTDDDELLPECQPLGSLQRFRDECIINKSGARIPSTLAYLTYALWFIDQYNDGPSAEYQEFRECCHEIGLRFSIDQDDVSWMADCTLVKTLPHFLSEEETESLMTSLSRTLTTKAWDSYSRTGTATLASDAAE